MTAHDPRSLTGPSVGVGFSQQTTPDGQKLVGIHVDLPLSSFVFAMSLEAAEELSRNFGPELRKTIQDIRTDTHESATLERVNPLIVPKGH